MCKACKTQIGDAFRACPVCGMAQTDVQETASFYPATKKIGILFFWRRLLVAFLWIGGALSCLINALVGGVPWAIYVVLGAYAAYVIFLEWETAEISLIRRIISGSVAISFLLFGIEKSTQSGAWATEFAIPLVILAGLIAAVTLYFSAFRRFAAQFLPMLLIFFGAMVAAALGIRGIVPMRWPLIALSGFAFLAFIAIVITFWRRLWAEVKKKLHR